MAARMSSTSVEKEALQELANSVVCNYVLYCTIEAFLVLVHHARGLPRVGNEDPLS